MLLWLCKVRNCFFKQVSDRPHSSISEKFLNSSSVPKVMLQGCFFFSSRVSYFMASLEDLRKEWDAILAWALLLVISKEINKLGDYGWLWMLVEGNELDALLENCKGWREVREGHFEMTLRWFWRMRMNWPIEESGWWKAFLAEGTGRDKVGLGVGKDSGETKKLWMQPE